MRATVALASATLLLAACILDRSGVGTTAGEGSAQAGGGSPASNGSGGGSAGGAQVGGMGGTGGMPVVGCVVDAAARRFITCAARVDGTVWCWGDNSDGAIGTEDTSGAVITPTQIPGLSDIVEVAVASRMAYARSADGTMYSWGLNDVGQLGLGSYGGTYPTPGTVNGLSDVTQITAGRGHVCALDQGGQAYCWGWNNNDQIGDNSGNNRNTPIPVLSNVQQIAAGGRSTCAVRSDNTVWCWGRNHHGQSGQPAGSPLSVPTQILGLSADEVAVGGRHACARDARGQVWCWGHNDAYELGSEGPSTHVPKLVPDVTAQRIYAAGFRSCALLTNGELSCWGEPILLGANDDNTPSDSSGPTLISELSLNGKVGFALGSQHICGGNAAGQFVCAGRNDLGQLGDGTYDPRLDYRPAQLMCP